MNVAYILLGVTLAALAGYVLGHQAGVAEGLHEARTALESVHVFTYAPGMTAAEVLAARPKDCRVSHPDNATTIIECGPFFPGAYMPRSCEGNCGSAPLAIVAGSASSTNVTGANLILGAP